MDFFGIGNRVARCLYSPLVLMWAALASGNAATEEKLELLQYGTKTYQNVTVTTKAKDYIFIAHATGIATLRVTNLSPEVLQRLGYGQIDRPKGSPESGKSSKLGRASDWAKQTVAGVEGAKAKGMAASFLQPAAIDKSLLLPLCAIALALYCFYCWCCKLVVEKAAAEPGVLIWVPLLQLMPLFRAAGMPLWWVLALFVPVLNVLAAVIWCLKMSEVRGKSRWFALLLILPVTGSFAFIYLAFSNGGRADKDDRRIEVMTLETA